jgi:hypothetical protein
MNFVVDTVLMQFLFSINACKFLTSDLISIVFGCTICGLSRTSWSINK